MMLCTGAPKADTLARLTNVHQPLHGGSLAQTGSVYGLPERVTLQWPHEPCPSQVIRIVLPCDGPPSRRTRAQSCEPPNDEQPSSGPSQSHVQPAAVGEKAEGTSSIIPHCGKQYDLLLPAFEPVYGFDFDLGELLGSVAQGITEPVSVVRVRVKQIVQ
jgi:hypothetical protein